MSSASTLSEPVSLISNTLKHFYPPGDKINLVYYYQGGGGENRLLHFEDVRLVSVGEKMPDSRFPLSSAEQDTRRQSYGIGNP